MSCPCQELAGGGIEVSPACIGQLWLFENLEPREKDALVRAAVRRRLQRGQAIFMQGEPAQELFLVKAGRVKLAKVTEDGAEITLDIRKAGDFLGENMLADDVPYPVGAWCMEETLTCGFTRRSFESLVTDHPNIGLQVIRNLSRHISWLTDRVGSMSGSNLESRLYGVLVNVAREHGVRGRDGLTIQFPLTHEDLSFLVGAHRVSITRAMKALYKSGKIIREGKALTVSLGADMF